MSGKKHFAVISSQMDRSEKHIEKTNGKDVPEVKKVEESSESQSLQVPLDGDIPIFTEEFLNYNKGNYSCNLGPWCFLAIIYWEVHGCYKGRSE